MVHFFAKFIVLTMFLQIPKVLLLQSYQKYQCSLPTQGDIYSLVGQDHVAFQLYDRSSWLLKKRKYVSCFKRGLKLVPQGIDDDIEILNLAQNSITRIRKEDFKSYSSLVAISILNNCIEIDFHHADIPRCSSWTHFSVETGAFQHLESLAYLAISGNIMHHLPQMLPSSILVLFASFSSLKPIVKKDMMNLNALEVIGLSTNCITGDLKHLCLGNFTIEEPVFAAENLKYLDLSYDNFKQIPSYLFQQSLLGIKLRGNPFHYVNANDFQNATNITYLNMAWTSQYEGHMQPLHIEQGALDPLLELTVLDLSGNMITSVPKGFLSTNLKLVALNLELNCLLKIEINPTVLPKLPLLKTLQLAGNSFCNYTDNLYPNKPFVSRLKLGEAYLRFPSLTTLAIGLNNGIPHSFFSKTFTYLYFLFGIKFDEIDNDSFDILKHLPNLPVRHITLVGCNIRILDTSSFSGLNLSYLDISSNGIGESSAIENDDDETNFKLSTSRQKIALAVQYMSSQAGNIESYIMNFHQNSNRNYLEAENYITRVNISKNGITDLKKYPLEYFSFAMNLDLAFNHITYIRANTFKSFQLLQVLNLKFNPIRRIHPDALTSLINLSLLKLNISVMQEDITLDFLKKAQRHLTLRFGERSGSLYRLLQFYKDNSTNFPNITVIDVSGIPIPPFLVSTNQVIFEPLRNLRVLIMNQAGLAYRIQSNFFKGLPYLHYLSMKDSWLQEFPSQALQNMTKLTYLDLSNNQIEYLAIKMFPTFPRLKTLLLSHNFIYEIEPGTLHTLQKRGLQSIDLSFNRIWNIGPTIIDRTVLKNLRSLDIRGSFVDCECSLVDTFGWLVHSGIMNRTILPGFVPDCSSTLINYYGGCIACSQARKSAVNPNSLFSYVVTNNCHEYFLSLLALFFILFFIMFFSVGLISTNVHFKKKLTNFLLRDVRLQLHSSREAHADDNGRENIGLLPIFAYDGFVFYDKNNVEVSDWLDAKLIPQLENGNPSFKISVVGREDWCGSTQVQQLLLRMRASRKTIVILSDEFASTPQCQYVLSVLEEWVYYGQCDRSILITFGKTRPTVISKLQKCKTQNAYSTMHYSTLSENHLFWTLLKNCMVTM